MALSNLLVQLVALALVLLPLMEACRDDNDCISLDHQPVQCCNGECIYKYNKCPFWTVESTVSLVFAGAVIVAAFVVCYFCCSCCPGYKHRSRATGTIIISSQPPYQQFTDHTAATNTAASSPGIGVFYPQPPSTEQYPLRHPMEVEDDLEESAAPDQMKQTQPSISYAGFARQGQWWW